MESRLINCVSKKKSLRLITYTKYLFIFIFLEHQVRYNIKVKNRPRLYKRPKLCRSIILLNAITIVYGQKVSYSIEC